MLLTVLGSQDWRRGDGEGIMNKQEVVLSSLISLNKKFLLSKNSIRIKWEGILRICSLSTVLQCLQTGPLKYTPLFQ